MQVSPADDGGCLMLFTQMPLLENNSKKTLEEIGNSYGVTKECIRQIEKRALNKIANLEITRSSLISYIK